MSERTPLYDSAARAGAVFLEDAGWLMPAHFGDVATEYRQAREGAALFDISHHGKVEMTGADAARFLHNLCTNEIIKLPVDAGCEAFLTTAQAKVVADVLVWHLQAPDGQESLWLDLAPGTAEKVVEHLDRFIISEQVELTDRSREFAQLHLAGPEAKAVLGKALREEMPHLQDLQQMTARFGAEAACQIRRHDPLGLLGYDLVCRNGAAAVVWQALLEAGARPAGLAAYEVLRVEAGTPVDGVDISEANLPQEIGRTERAVSFNKGCYIGQETVARLRTYGHVNRSLVGLKLVTDEAVPRGSRLYRDGKDVGEVTSAVRSPRLQRGIALAYVRRGSQEPGTVLEVETPQGRRAAEVAPLPFTGLAGSGPT